MPEHQPVSTLQVLSSSFLLLSRFHYFHKTSSRTSVNYSNVFNVYLFVCMHSCKWVLLFCAHIFKFHSWHYYIFHLYLFHSEWFLRSIHGTRGKANNPLFPWCINSNACTTFFASPLSQRHSPRLHQLLSPQITQCLLTLHNGGTRLPSHQKHTTWLYVHSLTQPLARSSFLTSASLI